MNALDTVSVKLHREGHNFVAGFALVTFLVFLVSQTLGWICLLLTAWCVYFFRDPERIVPSDAGVMVSPGDGTVSAITKTTLPPELGDSADVTRISIFLNVFNVHVNRFPVSGDIVKSVYVPGRFGNAADSEASEQNERQLLLIREDDQSDVGIAQVAGLVARRIVCDAKEGQRALRGDRYGIIRFGSRMDIYVPGVYDVTVQEGQTMIGGETVIARRAG